MRAGKLNKKIEIQEDRGTTRDAAGKPVPNWTTINNGERWASIVPTSGVETQQGGKQHGVVSYEIRTRYLAGVTRKMRVKFGTRTFGILSAVNTDERGAELVMVCRENV